MMFVGFLMASVMSVAKRLEEFLLVSLERVTESSLDSKSVIVDVKRDRNQRTRFCYALHGSEHVKEDLNLHSHRGGWTHSLKEFVHSQSGSSTWNTQVRQNPTHHLLTGLTRLVGTPQRIVGWFAGLLTGLWGILEITGFLRCVLLVQNVQPYWIKDMTLIAQYDDHLIYHNGGT